MADVIDRLVVAMNEHDLDGAAGLMHEDYRSDQPAHPSRSFVGRSWALRPVCIARSRAYVAAPAKNRPATTLVARPYGEADVERPYQVLAPRQLGLPLGAIGAVLEGNRQSGNCSSGTRPTWTDSW